MEPTTVVPPDRYEEALRCLLGRRRSIAAQSVVARLAAAGRLTDGCLRAVLARDGTMLAVGLVVVIPGRTATITLSPPRGREGQQRCESLLVDSCAAMETWPVDLAQSLLAVDDSKMLKIYLRSGFTHLADLRTMTRTARYARAADSLPTGVTLRNASDEELPAILDETYIDTQDCPGLHGLRDPKDIVIGHRAGGRVIPQLWQTILLRDTPVGCILLTCGDDSIADLAYVGLTPQARGKGIATAVVAHMMSRLPEQGMRVLRLAVDANNVAAKRVYRTLGFKHTNTQRAVIRSTRGMQVGDAPAEDVHMTSTPPRSHGG